MMDMFEARMGGYGNGGWVQDTSLKCKDCDYCQKDSWNQDRDYFCEAKEDGKDTIKLTDKACNEYRKIGEG